MKKIVVEGRKLIEQKQLSQTKGETMRHSGRQNSELREIKVEKDFRNADSSVLILEKQR